MWAIGVITYFLLCGYTPFDRDSNIEEMQAILAADYRFEPDEFWRNVSQAAREFIKRCLTIDPTARMTAHDALTHPWITGEGAPEGDPRRNQTDLLPTVKSNFNARRTLHAAIDTIRAINQLRAGGLAAVAQNAMDAHHAADGSGDAMQGVVHHGAMPTSETVSQGIGQLGQPEQPDPRGDGRGQTEEQMAAQQKRVMETAKGLWARR